jgi:hypothetical protein
MHLILNVHHADYDDECFCALVTLTPEQAQELLDLCANVQSLQRECGIFRAERFDSIDIITHKVADDENLSQDGLDKLGFGAGVLSDADAEIAMEYLDDIDMARLVIESDEVRWAFYERHCDVEVTTDSIAIATLEDIAAGRPVTITNDNPITHF